MSRLQRTLVEEVQTYAKAQNFDIVLAGDTALYADDINTANAVYPP